MIAFIFTISSIKAHVIFPTDVTTNFPTKVLRSKRQSSASLYFFTYNSTDRDWPIVQAKMAAIDVE